MTYIYKTLITTSIYNNFLVLLVKDRPLSEKMYYNKKQRNIHLNKQMTFDLESEHVKIVPKRCKHLHKYMSSEKLIGIKFYQNLMNIAITHIS